MASLVGSVHCAGMCGGFVCFYSSTAPDQVSPTGTTGWQSPLRAHALYNVGRLLSYLMLGALAGLIGSRVSGLGTLAGVQHAAALVSGVLMVGWALSSIAQYRGISLGTVQAPRAWQRALGSALAALRSQPIGVRALITGLLTTLLPCGWLYVFVATAGGTGAVLPAMGLMFIFWLGTVPALVAVGVGAQRVLTPFRRHLPVASALIVLALGLWTMSGHLRGGSTHDLHIESPIEAQTAHNHGH